MRYWSTLFLGYFLWGEQQEVTRHKDETNFIESLDYRVRGNDEEWVCTKIEKNINTQLAELIKSL